VVEWPVDSQSILQDIDTRDALRRLRS
jgi:hypothetical protein